MLIDMHTCPGDLSPDELAEAVADAGLDGYVVTDSNRVDRLAAYLGAASKVGLRAFAGIELMLERGTLVFIPRKPDQRFYTHTWSPGTRLWALEDILDRLRGLDGALMASHPYCRDLDSVLGDLVYGIGDLAAVETRVGRGRSVWNRLADSARNVMNAAGVGSCGGSPAHLGSAATVIPGEIPDEAALVEALVNDHCLAVELVDRVDPQRFAPERIERRSSDDQRSTRRRSGEDRSDRSDAQRSGRRGRRGGRRPERR